MDGADEPAANSHQATDAKNRDALKNTQYEIKRTSVSHCSSMLNNTIIDNPKINTKFNDVNIIRVAIVHSLQTLFVSNNIPCLNDK